MRIALSLALLATMAIMSWGCDQAEPAGSQQGDGRRGPEPVEAQPDESVFAGLEMQRLLGGSVHLEDYHGQVVLLVNVASECGYTPQYEGLQALHERYGDEGLAVVAVPSNDFGNQEPGSAEDIAEFCETNFGVAFDMLAKSPVTGDEKIELYRRLTDPANDPTDAGELRWNFEKFVIDRRGRVLARFPSDVEPTSQPMIAALESALQQGE